VAGKPSGIKREGAPPGQNAGLVEIVLLIAFVATPLALTPGLLLGYDVTPKLAIVYVAAAILLLLSRSWWPGAVHLWRSSLGRLFYLLLLAQAASLVLSAALSHDPILAVAGTSLVRLGALTQIVILFVVAVLAAQVSVRPAFTRRLLVAIEVCGAIAGIYGILQYIGWDPILPHRLYTVRFTADVVRPPATLRQAIYFANFLLPVILISAALAIHETRVTWRRFHLGILSIVAAALLLTGTRSALLGLLLGGILFGLIESRRIGAKRMLAYLGVCALACAAFLSLLAFSRAGKSFRIRTAQWVQDSAGGTRLMVWRECWPLIANHWLAGIGPEMFAGEFRSRQSLQLSRAYPDRYHEDPHNFMIAAAVSQGFIGLALLSGLIALGLVSAYVCVRRGVPEGAMLAAAIVAMTISEQFDPLTVTNALYLHLPAALAVALAVPGASQPDPVAAFVAPGPVARAVRTAVALGILAAAALYVVPDALQARAGRRLTRGDVPGARISFQHALRFPFPQDCLWFSQQMAAAANSLPEPRRQQALAAAREASAEAERSGEQRFIALYQSALLAVLAGDLGNAEVKLRAAVDTEPWWYRVHVMLAQVLWLTGRDAEAEREAVLAIESAGSQEPKVRIALESARAQYAAGQGHWSRVETQPKKP
jgi:O-antigen ligase